MKKLIILIAILFLPLPVMAEITQKDFLNRMKEIIVESNPEKKLQSAVKVMNEGDEYMKFIILIYAAEASLELKRMDKAKNYADQLLSLAKKYPKDWNYGNAIHDANLVLGRVAIRENNIELAKESLIKAGNTPGSPQLNTMGPKSRLAYELLAKGHKETVLSYIELCRKFWEMNNGRLDKWAAEIRGGGKPDREAKGKKSKGSITARAHFNAAVDDEKNKDYESAIANFSKAIAIDPHQAAYYLNRGTAHRRIMDYDKAIADFKKSLEVDPKFTIAYYHLGQLYLYDKKDRATACFYYKKSCDAGECSVYEAQKRNGFCPRTKSELAELNSKDPQIKKLTDLIKKNPHDITAYFGRGMRYENNRDYHSAIKDYTSMLKIGLKDFSAHKRWISQAYRFRANAYQEIDQYDLAIKDYEIHVSKFPRDTGINSSIGNMYLHDLKDRKKGCFYYADLGKDEKNFMFNRALETGQCYPLDSPRYDKNYLDKLIADATQAIKKNPKAASPYLSRGRALADQFQFDLALQDYNMAIELDAKFVQAYNYRARAYMSKGKGKIGVENYKKALTIDPNDVLANVSLANHYTSSSDVKIREKGCAYYKKACELGVCQGHNITKKFKGRFGCNAGQ